MMRRACSVSSRAAAFCALSLATGLFVATFAAELEAEAEEAAAAAAEMEAAELFIWTSPGCKLKSKGRPEYRCEKESPNESIVTSSAPEPRPGDPACAACAICELVVENSETMRPASEACLTKAARLRKRTSGWSGIGPWRQQGA